MEQIEYGTALDADNRTVLVPGTGVAHLGPILSTILRQCWSGYSTLTSISLMDLFFLMRLCSEDFSPTKLIGKLLLQDDDRCGDSDNRALTLTEFYCGTDWMDRYDEEPFLMTPYITINSMIYPMTKVMVFKPIWLVRFWAAPIKSQMKPEAFEEEMAIVRQLVPSISLEESDIYFGYPQSASNDTHSRDLSNRLPAPESSCCIIL